MKHCKSCRRDLETSAYNDNQKTCCECLNKRKGKTITIEQCHEFAKTKSGKCLSTEYINTRTKMNWKCIKNHQWITTFVSIKSGSWCQSCAGKTKHTIEECREFAISKNGLCLSTEYKNSREQMSWECTEGHQWSAIFDNVKNQGTWCLICSGNSKPTIEECREFAKNKGGNCLSSEYYYNKSEMNWQCSEGHIWSVKFNTIKSGHWCPECVGCKKHTIEDCREFAKSKNGLCLSAEYKCNKTKMNWQCSQGHQWTASFHSIKNHSNWCPNCSSFKSEKLCREIFEDLLLEPFNKIRPQWLEGLELDGYNENLNMGFEYNGIQHYEFNKHFHNDDPEIFEQQKNRDKKK